MFFLFWWAGSERDCLARNKLGYIKGDHPMAKFADGFLTKNLMSYIKELDEPDNEDKS